MTPPLTARMRVARATSDSSLAAGAGSSAMNAIAVGPCRNSTSVRPLGLLGRHPGERVLGHVERRPGLAQRVAHLGRLGHRQAAVVGHDQALASLICSTSRSTTSPSRLGSFFTSSRSPRVRR